MALLEPYRTEDISRFGLEIGTLESPDFRELAGKIEALQGPRGYAFTPSVAGMTREILCEGTRLTYLPFTSFPPGVRGREFDGETLWGDTVFGQIAGEGVTRFPHKASVLSSDVRPGADYVSLDIQLSGHRPLVQLKLSDRGQDSRLLVNGDHIVYARSGFTDLLARGSSEWWLREFESLAEGHYKVPVWRGHVFVLENGIPEGY